MMQSHTVCAVMSSKIGNVQFIIFFYFVGKFSIDVIVHNLNDIFVCNCIIYITNMIIFRLICLYYYYTHVHLMQIKLILNWCLKMCVIDILL